MAKHIRTIDVGVPTTRVDEIVLFGSSGRRFSLVRIDSQDLPESLDATPEGVSNRECRTKFLHDLRDGRRAYWFGADRSRDLRAWATDRWKNGWPEGAQKALLLAEEVRATLPPAISVKRRPTWTDDGDSIDVDRALAKQWDSCYREARRRISGAPQTISIAAEFGGTAEKSENALFWAGAAALALADVLEEAGYQTELTAVHGTNCYSGDVLQFSPMKRASEPLQPDVIAGLVCSAGGFRVFGIMAVWLGFAEPGISAGCTTSARPMLTASEKLGLIAPVDILIESCYTRENAIEQIKRAVEKIQGGVEEEAEV